VIRRPKVLFGVLLGVVLGFAVLLGVYQQTRARTGDIVTPDPAYEARTEIRPSLVPGADNGLFAVAAIREGAVIGELGGRLVETADPVYAFAYLAALKDCALSKAQPYKYLDSRELGGHVSRINFAPRAINGVATGLQNAQIDQLCQHPYIVFIALRDIEPGEEILTSYGDSYDYDPFMNDAVVQTYFCQEAEIDCSHGFSYDP
jgi:membrane-associated protease RseP (regulator of RpoE activity)